MNDDDLAFSTIAQLARQLERRAVSSEELIRATIVRTERLEPLLNTYIRFMPEQALEQAKVADAEIAAGRYRGSLHGIPVSLKDLFDMNGIPTTAGARFLRDRVPSTDSLVAHRLRDAGAIFMGKANMNKFAGGESGDNPDYGRMHNPWNLSYSPGGSSGGSGAQVAAGLVALSVGSDNGGSIRIPAALCGVVGLKPTYGRISMDGMFPRAYTFDHPGPLTRTVEDAAIALDALAGPDAGDTTALDVSVPKYAQAVGEPHSALRVGFDPTFVTIAQPAVRQAFDAALRRLAELGFGLREIRLPAADELNALFDELFTPEWGAAHEPWLRDHPDEYPESWNARASLLIPAVRYIDAARRRRLAQVRYREAVHDVDVVATPTYPFDRRPFDGYPTIDGARASFRDALRYTMPFNLLGLPAVSVPCGFSGAGLPVGLQLVGSAFGEATVLRAARVYEAATEWHCRRPALGDTHPQSVDLPLDSAVPSDAIPTLAKRLQTG